MLDIQNTEGFELTDFGGNADYKIPNPPFTFEDYEIEYNQNDVGFCSCSVHGPMTAISAITGHKFDLKERKAIWNRAIKNGADPNIGYTLKGGVKDTADHWNGTGRKKLIYIRTEFDSEKFWEFIEKGYTGVFGGRFNKEFYKDIKADGDLDEIDFGMPTFGHVLAKNSFEAIFTCIDNYKGRSFNRFTLTFDQMKEMRSRGQIFLSVYFYVIEDDFNKLNGHERPTWADAAYKELGWLFDNYTGNAEVDFVRFQWMLKKYGIIEQVDDVVTEDKALTILYKLLKK